MTIPNFWGAIDWGIPVAVLMVLTIGLVVWSYLRTPSGYGVRWALGTIKVVAIGLLALCLLEPMLRQERAEPGANVMLVMADDSQSMQIKDRGQAENRASQLKLALTERSGWLGNLAEDFDVRRYLFNRKLRAVSDFDGYNADQQGSDILGNLTQVSQRYMGRPSAGILLLTDGNATTSTTLDSLGGDWKDLPPIYPVIVGNDRPAMDLGIQRIQNSQTNFESAPVTITVELLATGYQGKKVCVVLKDENEQELERKTIDRIEDGRTFAVRFQTQPPRRGVNFYSVVAFDESTGEGQFATESSAEATTINNSRKIAVNRGRGPFRVLYVTGRPNWELKFLRRAMAADEEIDLVCLVRIAKREAKFSFRGNTGQESNPLFKGFDNQDEDTAEQHDEPVFLRLGTNSDTELQTGFPTDAETLYEYDAIVLDDVEAKFFTEDQKSLLQKFVSIRGGGLLMLGGQESFGSGGYDKTAIAEMLPVYLDRVGSPPDGEYALNLTRDGWLQPWVRVASTEEKERKRLSSMPDFKTVNLISSIKPGATVMATLKSESGSVYPALAVQMFGKGRCAALLIGDWWRWHLRVPVENDDMMRSWRQTIRWLVADVPRRVELDIATQPGVTNGKQLRTVVRDSVYKPFDNANVAIEIETPEKKTIQLNGRPDDNESGLYATSFASQVPGAYRAIVKAESEDGSLIENRETGWVIDPAAEEFQSLAPNRSFLKTLAEKTGGELLEINDLDRFVKDLPNRKVPITETRTFPWWHRWSIFAAAISLLVAEWGLRRWKGMP